MNGFSLTNVQVMEPGEGIVGTTLHVRGGRIVAAEDADSTSPTIDGRGRLVTPGLVDVHTHAVGTSAYEASADELVAATEQLGRFGTTCVLPTLYGVLTAEHVDHLEKLTSALRRVETASTPAFHFEGPFLALPGAGAATLPGDLELLERLFDAVEGQVAAVSISPDAPGILPVIEWLTERNIVTMITHTGADVRQTTAAIDAGARHATHFYDVFYPPDEIDPGVRPVGSVEAILADPRCSVDFICDGVHVDPVAIRAALAAKTFRGVLLISDSNVGAGLADGVYQSPWGYPVKVERNHGTRIYDPARPNHGTLAGSNLTMDRAVSNAIRWLGLPPEHVWAMATSGPARLVGLANKGTLHAGADADLVLWDETDDGFRAARTWVSGRCVFRRE